MEYLTLQDIPHRHYNPLHSHSMASSQYTERRMGSLAAVRESLPQPVSQGTVARAPIHLPELSSLAPSPPSSGQESTTEPPSSFPTAWHPSHHPLPSDGTNSTLRRFSEEGKHTYLKLREQNTYHENAILDTFLMNLQNPNSRSSPPIQPNERGYADKLPSFSEFLDTTRADHTPPHTPSRRQGSHDESPGGARLQFDDILWQDKGHRRIDTLGDIYAQTGRANGSDAHPQDHRRMSSVADPTLTRRNSPAYAPAPTQQHRPSYSYPALQVQAAYTTHMRHHSSPAPPQQPVYRHSPSHQGLAAPGAYPPPAPQGGSVHVHRPSYYQEHAPAPAYAYGTPYVVAAHPGYENGYGEVRFQQHVGADPNNFNRKRRGNLPKESTNMLKQWFSQHRSQPYPTEDQKIELCNITGLTMNQVSNWFINARRRAPQKEAREREANGGRGTEER